MSTGGQEARPDGKRREGAGGQAGSAARGRPPVDRREAPHEPASRLCFCRCPPAPRFRGHSPKPACVVRRLAMMPGRGDGTGGAAGTALRTSLVVLLLFGGCCGAAAAPKTARIVSSALAPPSKHPLPRLSGPRLELRAADAAPENNGAHAHTEDEEALAPLPSPPSPAPPHGSAPPVQALVAPALQESMVNQTPLALTVMAPERSAPVPLKVYQASFVVKVRVVPAQPALSCASPPARAFPAPLPVSVGSSGAGQNCSPANSSPLRRRLLL